jgi:hypothetical protein
MSEVPEIYGPDGVLRSTFTYTTGTVSKFFTGIVSDSVADLQVSIRGSEWSSDPDFITFSSGVFTIPNPSSYPDGLDLYPGLNEIKVRSVDIYGTVSSPAELFVTLITEKDIGVIARRPTNVSIERRSEDVIVKIEGINSEFFRGINFYASTVQGGGARGYQRINVDTIVDYELDRVYSDLVEMPVDISIPLNPSGDHLVDPTYFNIAGNLQDSGEVIISDEFDERYEIPENIKDIKVNVTISGAEDKKFYSFIHNRLNNKNSIPKTIPRSEFRSIPATDYLYYVCSAVYYDSYSGYETESAFSPEVVGGPLKISISGGSLPVVSKDQILNNIAVSINRSHPDVGLHPGSVVRDVVVDPVVFEVQRLRFIADFIHRSQSFSDLLKIDDPENSGTSISVSRSQYKTTLKQAFYLTNDNDVQELIDQSFEKMANRFGVRRGQGIRSVGEVTFYTTKRPSSSKIIPLGTVVSSGSTRFNTTAPAEINLNNIASFYSPITGRYSVIVPVQAESVGRSGNVSKNQIKTIVNQIPGLSVTNENSTYGGRNEETNRELAVRAQEILTSVDTGTEGGYKKAVRIPGVIDSVVVSSGDELMQRDFDGTEHRGGKVDIWIDGTSINAVTDNFAFSFMIGNNIQFELIGDPSEYRFEAIDENLGLDNPIIEMLTYYDFGLKNITTGDEYNLSGVAIEDYRTIRLSTSIYQPPVSALDVVRGDYRYRKSSGYVMTRQPVLSLSSLVGQISGQINPSKYYLDNTEDPLVNGRSSISSGKVVVVSNSGVPSGTPVSVVGESHVLIGNYIDYLYNLGANLYTVEVWNQDRTLMYSSPFTLAPDYTIIDGDENNPIGIKRTSTSSISSGESVLIDYQHDENFTVRYTTDSVVADSQRTLESMRHITADVLSKSIIRNSVDIEVTISLVKGISPSDVDSKIRTSMSNYVESLGSGGSFRQSDIIGIIEKTSGVSYVVVPISKMVRSINSLVLREYINVDRESDSTYIPSLSNDTNKVYLLNTKLSSTPKESGGSSGSFKGVYYGDKQTVSLDLFSSIGTAPYNSYIIGGSGYSILGFSDDATLESQGYTTFTERTNRRIEISSNRVVVSLPSSILPTAYEWSATYNVGVDTGVGDINASRIEKLSVGDFSITYDEDK